MVCILCLVCTCWDLNSVPLPPLHGQVEETGGGGGQVGEGGRWAGGKYWRFNSVFFCSVAK